MVLRSPLLGPARAAPRRELYSRHRMAPGFSQEALSATTLVRVPGRRDPVGDHLSLLAGAMGIERQWMVGQPAKMNLDSMSRLMLLNPAVLPWVLTGEQAETLQRTYEVKPYTAVNLTGADPKLISKEAPTLLRGDTAVRFYAETQRGIAVGRTPADIAKLAAGPGPSTVAGAEAALAATSILADLLAASQVYRDAFDDEPMPRAPNRQLFESVDKARYPLKRQITLMIVGGGGALAHAFLEALMLDRILGQALEGGRLLLVDFDQYENSNLSRQTLAGGPHNLGRGKANVTAEELRTFWPARDLPEIIPIGAPFDESMVDGYRPDVICLFPDNYEARAQAWNAAKDRSGQVVIFAGTGFAHGFVRTVATGSGCCFDCGPEGLSEEAAMEREARLLGQDMGASCSAEITPSNVLSNGLAGAVAALQLRRWLLDGTVAETQRVVNWMIPRRLMDGPRFQPCSCWR